MKNFENVTYKQSLASQDLSRIIKAIGVPTVVFLITITIIDMFGLFGANLIAPLVALMWVVGVITGFLLPSHRDSILTETMTTIVCYIFGLAALRQLLGLVSGVSTQMLIASFDQPISMASSNAIPGYLQTAIWITAVMTPVGFFGMQVKRLMQFRRKASKQKFFDQTRSIRNNNQGNI